MSISVQQRHIRDDTPLSKAGPEGTGGQKIKVVKPNFKQDRTPFSAAMLVLKQLEITESAA